jgi:mannose-6-phosphate isomerase-like protein (cupin superfamily)
MSNKIIKPWGYEIIIEKNDRYVMKELCMFAGKRCSYQYHEKKKETVYVTSGLLRVIYKEKSLILKPGESVTIETYEEHRMEAIETCVYIEASTPELDDVVRLEDDYGRL